MVLLSPEVQPSVCYKFEADIFLLFHTSQVAKGFETTLHVGSVCQICRIEEIYHKVSKMDIRTLNSYPALGWSTTNAHSNTLALRYRIPCVPALFLTDFLSFNTYHTLFNTIETRKTAVNIIFQFQTIALLPHFHA